MNSDIFTTVSRSCSPHPTSVPNGHSHPPRNTNAPSSANAYMFTYDDSWNIDQRMPLYSMNTPPATSDSPVGMSNGGRSPSAIEAMRKITNPSGCHTISGTVSWYRIIWYTSTLAVTITAPISARINGTSYEMSCAAARMPPSSAYLLSLPQPASKNPMNDNPETARMYSRLSGIGLISQSAVKGTATNTMSAGMKIMNTASSNATKSAVAGRRSSFVSSLNVSAIGCSSPNGPVRVGPSRYCIRATILRSYHVAYITPTVITSVNATTPRIPFTNGWSMSMAGAESSIFSLPVHAAEHDVHRAQDHHRIRQELVQTHLPQRRKVAERRRPHLQPVGLVAALRDQVHAPLTARRFHFRVHLARRRPQPPRQLFRHDGSFRRQLLQRLFDDAHRLPHLLQPYQVAVVHVAVVPDRHLEVEAVVHAVRLVLPQVPRHARSPQHRPAQPVGDRLLRREDADALAPRDEDLVLRQQLVKVADPLLCVLQHLVAPLNEVVRDLPRQPAHAEVRVHQPVAAHFLEQLLQVLALGEGVREAGPEDACVDAERPHEHEVAGKPVQLCQDHPNLFRALRYLHVHQPLDGHHVGQLRAELRQVLRPVAVADALRSEEHTSELQ